MEPMRARPEPNPPEPSSPEATPNWINRRATEQAVRAANARRASGRRRFVDPTTCERDYSTSELEFMQAMQDYKQKSGRMFPTWSEVLEVLRDLGYRKPPGELDEEEDEDESEIETEIQAADAGSTTQPPPRAVVEAKPDPRIETAEGPDELNSSQGPPKTPRRRKPGSTPSVGDSPTSS